MGSTTVAIQGNQACPSGASAVRRCFEITPGTVQTATVTFYYRDAEENGQDAAHIWHWTDPVWEEETFDGRDDSGVEDNWVRATGVDGYSPFAAANDIPTAVILSSFEAAPTAGSILVTWETAIEIDNVGFNLYRGGSPDGPYVKLNESLIPSQSPGSPFGAEYAWLDEAVELGATYYYKLEDVEVGGKSTFHGPISASAQVPTAVSMTALSVREGAVTIGLPVGLFLVSAVGLTLVRRDRRRKV
jgi:hypothetical protein